MNIPWPTPGMGDADYLYAFEKIVLPIAYEFAPEFVISMSISTHLCQLINQFIKQKLVQFLQDLMQLMAISWENAT